MATVSPELHNPAEISQISPSRFDQLQELAEEHGWTLDQALRRALDITEIVLDAKEDPKSNVYVYKDGRRYSIEIE
jgi:hypothetical protein